MRSPIGLALGALLVAVAGCGDGPAVEQVRVLQMSPGLVSKQARDKPVLAASLSGPSGPGALALPVVRVPDVGSIAGGATNRGRLVNGLMLPERGPYWLTWDPILGGVPNRADRRWATDRMLAFLLTVLRDYALAHPGLPPILVGDLSRPYGGPFGSDYGGLGHASHQNGLDADVYYPRADRAVAPPYRPQDVDRALAQDLVNRFVGFGAQFTFVGLHLGLGGPPAVVQAIDHHDDHVHVRIANARR